MSTAGLHCRATREWGRSGLFVLFSFRNTTRNATTKMLLSFPRQWSNCGHPGVDFPRLWLYVPVNTLRTQVHNHACINQVA